ncbi:winged helix-turn-helix domain-containing protein [Paraoerskovia marina]|uniref:winged helix-turn-helix domain-containing protein n=1 Tax=Paraoerskovia marina TaxID=545619 RepID=UPI0009F62A56|nr:winged helix-turn-helix domain-containing protein [Paraoerskovia marina]
MTTLAPVTPRISHQDFLDRLASIGIPLVRISVDERIATVDGVEHPLTQREVDLLNFLSAAPGRVASRDDLLATVWRGERLRAGTRTVDVHVGRLRTKLGLDAVRTVRGVGYGLGPDVQVVRGTGRAAHHGGIPHRAGTRLRG